MELKITNFDKKKLVEYLNLDDIHQDENYDFPYDNFVIDEEDDPKYVSAYFDVQEEQGSIPLDTEGGLKDVIETLYECKVISSNEYMRLIDRLIKNVQEE